MALYVDADELLEHFQLGNSESTEGLSMTTNHKNYSEL
jgi:hypothetical protein